MCYTPDAFAQWLNFADPVSQIEVSGLIWSVYTRLGGLFRFIEGTDGWCLIANGGGMM